ncbi:MAG: hypothetical protein A3H70_03865 [Candidatus Komeilibacteria bacterium RIFCSPLOWO2_02_FULL_48_11]|uniref:Uncharacterized protein n=1 Tax=Candidatus Komeilibacteria bacterium RIFCSPLOWO2_02_FULL_48_11 TaxID=1798553 RepID=A0A1G2BR56_9BACT|nr:MAG: hypothetical protein A3H70_03865 [Candidatus Komeilibacteria bacterium RIFCSPLOWO2_02_FULL_48_11]
MRLLIVAQKVDKNDPVLGFFHQWLEEFAKHCQNVIVICLAKGEYSLSSNIQVLPLGKESGQSRIKYLANFYKYIWQERNNYDAVFVHMNPEYVVLGGLLWRAWNKPIGLWYTHKSVNLKLRLALRLSHLIFTASRESFRLKSKKVRITGHGIDTEFFKPKERGGSAEFKIISVGRVSATKNQLSLVKIFAELSSQTQKLITLELIGAPAVDKDKKYLQQIKDFITVQGLGNKIMFLGAIPQRELVKHYQDADLLVNLSQTGSLDKDVLEAAACNLDVLTTNEAFQNILPKQYLANNSEPEIKRALLEKIERPLGATALRAVIESYHSLPRLIKLIVASF